MHALTSLYFRLTLDRPLATLAATALAVLALAALLPRLQLDASAESLALRAAHGLRDVGRARGEPGAAAGDAHAPRADAARWPRQPPCPVMSRGFERDRLALTAATAWRYGLL